MVLTEGELEFDFSNAIQAFKFDEVDNASPNYHGLTHCMKSVDFIVEREHDWLFVEVKDYTHPNAKVKKEFYSDLAWKYKDTFLYRWAEGKVGDKPIHYVCLVDLNDDALILTIMHRLKQKLPIGLKPVRWQNELLRSVVVVNMAKWNVHFSEWPVVRVS